jgi:V/A-type H+/Na+-transporting ATPase subunit I
MIVPMTKVYIAARAADRDRLLDALRKLGVMHLIPVDATQAVPDDDTQAQLDALGRAEHILETHTPAGDRPDLSPLEAAREVVEIQRRSAEQSNRLTNLYRQIEQLDLWGDLRLTQLDALAETGVKVAFYAIPTAEVSAVQAECVQPLRELPGKETLLAVAWRGEDAPELPETAEPMERPTRDRPDLQAEAAEIDRALQADQDRLAVLAHLADDVAREHARVRAVADYIVAQRGGLYEGGLFAVQGWVPAAQADALAEQIIATGTPAAAEVIAPEPDEQPPTLIRYPRWARPIQALLDMLGTVPGYREFDLAPFFMLAMPIFTAMLVGDAGYGLVFLGIGGLMYNKITRAASRATAQLVLVFALATLIWGMLSGNAFGVGPDQVTSAGGVLATVGQAWQQIAIFWRSNPEESRDIVMQISFLLGCVHLSLAHIRRALAVAPRQEALAEIGWVGFVFGMFTLVWLMFFGDSSGPLIPPMATLWTLVGSWGVIVLFCSPDKNPLKRITFGVLGNLMSIPGAFGDMLSYIRLMAVGLASYYIASAFNGLAMGMSEATAWAIPATVLVLILAHSLNIGLCLVAIFAHGVRLNMLEFSTNAGVQWAGHPYQPFALQTTSTEGDA